jgi:hypothetical protein
VALDQSWTFDRAIKQQLHFMEADDMPAMEGQEASSLSYKQPEVNLSTKPTAVANLAAESGVRQTNFWRSAKW